MDVAGFAVPAVAVTLCKIFASLFAGLAALSLGLTPIKQDARGSASRWLAPPGSSKRAGELLALALSPCWVAAVGVVIFGQFYDQWGKWGYLLFCVSCAMPYVLLPLLFPSAADTRTPVAQRYVVKANAWIAIFSFIGNYWYTHYFYRVLKASYTFPAHRLNDVPVSMYFMTHAYFMFYHALSTMVLRRIRAAYEPGRARTAFVAGVVATMAYATALGESVTICGFPYYSFEDRDTAYTLGSAFYSIYFLVSFPAFALLDEDGGPKHTLSRACIEALASGMAVLCLLDFVRLGVGVPLFATS